MKKFLLSVVVVLGIATTYAQDSETYKPETGDVTAEFGLIGGIAGTAVNLSSKNVATPGFTLRGRYFYASDFAFRAGLNLTTDSKTNSTDADNSNSNSNSTFSLELGAEKHFSGTKNLSPYVGGDLLIGFASGSTSSKAGGKDAGGTSDPSTFGIGLKGVFGADYYFVKNVYLGVEAGLALVYSSTGGGSATDASGTKTEGKGGTNSFKINPVVGGIRLGFVF